MVSILEGTNSFGTNGIQWWIGQVAERKSWAPYALEIYDKDAGKSGEDKDIYNHRVKVNIVGKTDQIVEPMELPWAHVLSNPMSQSGYGGGYSSHKLEGGESVLGFYLDGDDQQKPVVAHVFYRDPRAADPTPNVVAGGSRKPAAKQVLDVKDKQEVVGKSPSNNSAITDKEFSKKREFSKTDGTPIGDTKEPIASNESSKEQSMSTAAYRTYEGLKRVKVESPATCKNDNTTSAITTALSDFSETLMKVENYGDFYVNKLTGAVVNLEDEIDLVAKKVGGYMTATTNSIRDSLFSNVEERISEFTNDLVPEDLKAPFGDALKDVTDEIHCLFGNIIAALKDTITGFLKDLMGNLINAPLCAAEQFAGTLLNNIMNGITETIGPILNSLTSVLGGALGTVGEMVDKALAGVGILYNFLGCDDHKCPLPSRYDVGLGPTQKERDNMNKLMESASLLNLAGSVTGLGGLVGSVKEAAENVKGASSIFSAKGIAGDPASLLGVGGCESNVLRCGPPTVELFGGAGVGGLGNAVINNLGQIIGVDLIERGLGYTVKRPPYVRFKDSCGDGSGAKATAIIADNGEIERIVMDSPGNGYKNTYDKIKTVYGDVKSDSVSQSANSDATPVIAEVDDVVVINSGYGYNSTDTISVGNAVVTPKVLGGRLVGVDVVNGGSGFTSIPEATINSATGQGAIVKVVLRFVPLTGVTEVSLDDASDQIIFVVNCVGKPLTRTRIGS